MHEWMIQLVDWSVQVIEKIHYPGIILLMFIESSFIPFPSELVMPQAGILAATGEMNIVMAIVCGIVGSILGALLNYYLALWLGRPFFLRYGKWFFCSHETFDKAEGFFQRHGEIGTFTGRLIPLIRQWISLPAGLARMNMPRFLFFTSLGSGLWVTILVVIGYLVGRNYELIKQHSKTATIIVLVLCAVLIAVYTIYQRAKKKRVASPAAT